MGEAADERRRGDEGVTEPRRERQFEWLTTVLLAAAALAAAWSGYQASLWSGIQSQHYSQAGGYRTRAAQAADEANQKRLADVSVVEGLVNATLSGDARLAEFYRSRARDELAPALDAWLAAQPLTNPDAPASPLAMPEYKLADDARAATLKAQADAAFAEGNDANNTSDRYTLATLLLAAVLFFAAISERFTIAWARGALLALAAVGLVTGVALMAAQPVAS